MCVASSIFMSHAEETPDSIDSRELNEVVVTGNSALQRISNMRLGAERLELSRLVQAPSFGGENDIIKSIALLPGVHSEGDGGGGFEVRGGNASQNLVLLDGISLYNPAHVMGIFSTFNDNAIGGPCTKVRSPQPTAARHLQFWRRHLPREIWNIFTVRAQSGFWRQKSKPKDPSSKINYLSP